MGSAISAGVALRSSALASPNDTVRVACVGFRGRGKDHIRAYSQMANVEIAALCDIDESVLNAQLAAIEKAKGKRPAAYTDIRKLLEDKSIDAISIATPNHSHTLQTIWACQAGKDVYVEKPCSHNMFEARQIVAAAQKYGRMVQHGSQQRSGVGRDVVQHINEGLLGDVYMARGLCFKCRDTIGRKPVEPVPAGVHYDLWLGPAPQHEYTANRLHYNWHWFWDYGNGDLGNQGIHQIDMARWGLGVKYPTKVSAIGGHFMFDDDQETPNTLTATFEFDEAAAKKMLVFEVRHWISNHEAGIGEPKPGNTVGTTFYGSKGYLSMWDEDNHKYASWLGPRADARPWLLLSRTDGQPLGQLHRRGAQPQAGGPARAHLGRRHLHHAGPPREHFLSPRPHAALRCRQPTPAPATPRPTACSPATTASRSSCPTRYSYSRFGERGSLCVVEIGAPRETN